MALGLLLAAGLVGAAATASAQPSTSPSGEAPTDTPYWQANFDEHVAHELKTEPSMRASFLQVVASEATSRTDLELSQTAAVLLDIIEHDATREHRLRALQVLSAIEPDHVGEQRYGEMMRRLYTLAEEDPSAQMRRMAAAVLHRDQTS